MYDPGAAIGFAHAQVTDRFTKVTWLIVKLLSSLLIVLMPIAWISRGIGAILMFVTFGLYAVVYSLILWTPVFGLLLGTSWLWLRFWPLRPILVVPGIALAVIGYIVLILAPSERDRDATLWRASFAGEWPFSWELFRAMKGQNQ